MSGLLAVRSRAHYSVNVDQSLERSSASLNAFGTNSIRGKDTTAQECQRDARPAPHGCSRSSSEILNSGGAKEESENRSMLALVSTNLSPRNSSSVPRHLTWRSFWTASRGIIFVISAMFFGAVMGLTTRLLELERNGHKRMHPIQILFSRMALTSFFGSIYLRYLSIPHYALGASGIRIALVTRGISGFVGVYGLYYSLQYLPLAEATVITFLAPLLGTWLSCWIMRVSWDIREVLAGLVSFLGVLMIAQPSLVFSTSKNPAPLVSANCTDKIDIFRPLTNNTCLLLGAQPGFPEATSAQRMFAVLIALTGVVGAAVAYCSTLWIGKRAHPLIVGNYFAVISTLISGVSVFFVSEVGFRLPADGREYIYLIATSVCGYIMQFLFVKGLQYEESNRPANMINTQLLFALAFDKIIWKISPGAFSIIGGGLVLVSTVYVAMLPKTVKSAGDEEQVQCGDDGDCELLGSSNFQVDQ